MKKEIKRYRTNQQEETNAAAVYRALSEIEPEKELQLIYQRLAESEERHAQFWQDQQQKAGVNAVPLRPSWQSRLLIVLARRFGPQFILPTLMSVENNNSNIYQQQIESKDTSLAAEEHSHHRILTALTESGSGLTGASIARLEGRHRSAGGNALRAAVLGANDGLVSNLSLVMGVAGAELSAHSILVTGVAGLLAGAISMALGEWLSVQSSREYYQRQIDIEEQELTAHPEEEAEELALIYQAKGVAREQAVNMAQQIIVQDRNALDTLAREELGIDPEELGGSAWEAAITSFLLFALGAIIPVLPFILLNGMPAVIISAALSGLALFVIGATITLMTGRSIWLSGLRQLLFGLLAAAVTYGIGWLVGVQLLG